MSVPQSLALLSEAQLVEGYRHLVANLLLCSLVGMASVGIFIIFALQTRLSQRGVYLRGMCEGFNVLRGFLADLGTRPGDNARECFSRVQEIIKRSRVSGFFASGCEAPMELWMWPIPDRYRVLRELTDNLMAEFHRYPEVKAPEALSKFILAHMGASEFEGDMAKIKRQVWLPWVLGIAAVMSAILLLMILSGWSSPGLRSALPGLLVFLIVAVILQFGAATYAIYHVLHKVDQ